MGIDLGIELAQLVISLLATILKGNPTAIEQSILDIVKKGYSAYEQQTGKPLDASLIQPIPPIE